MKKSLYPRLAIIGMKKNKRLYIPYLITCIGMVMMFYIIHSLSYSPVVKGIHGGTNLQMTLSLGKFVVAVFALIFLTYTNSFLSRRRNKEFGLYNILGMDKQGIARIIVWESLFVALIGLGIGSILGILLSKLAELALLNMVHENIDYRFYLKPEAIEYTFLLMGGIFLFLMIKSLFQVCKKKPLELLHSESVGEKPPKGNVFMAIIGAIMLGIAYYMAVTIQSPLKAMLLFFLAVVLVIIATYILFTVGSVVLCKTLQKNKGYYYKKNHFVSVSTMAYRMKRNGAGLASICILSTMVLVMFASTASLYFGAEDSLNNRFPRQSEIMVCYRDYEDIKGECAEGFRKNFEEVLEQAGVTPENVLEFQYADITGLLCGDYIKTDADNNVEVLNHYDDLRQIYFMTVVDYNRIMGSDYRLNPGQVLCATTRCEYKKDRITIGPVSFEIAQQIEKAYYLGDSMISPVSSMVLILSDWQEIDALAKLVDYSGFPQLSGQYIFSYDLNESDARVMEVFRILRNAQAGFSDERFHFIGSCLPIDREDFYSTFGGLFFIGIILSILFMSATVLIIYYKQISEGYEDQNRFDIMMKVGMTKKDIRKTINSQVLTTFFAPLLFAGLHICFAFPMVWKVLQIFQFYNLPLAFGVFLLAYAVFAVFYVLVYKKTANSYYSIVSNSRRE